MAANISVAISLILAKIIDLNVKRVRIRVIHVYMVEDIWIIGYK